MHSTKIKQMVLAALLVALSLIIPISFGFLKIIVGPFTATLASHVPLFIAMLISPKVAAIVGLGSTIGFFITSAPVVALRAATHIIVGYIGGKIFRKNENYKGAIAATAPIHGILEGLAIIPFGIDSYTIVLVTVVGTMVHHCIDAFLAYLVARSLNKAQGKDTISILNEKAA